MVISAIDDIVLESEESVIQAMLDACDKAWMILENYEGDDFSAFSIFQEAATENSDKGTKKRGIISRILGIIPSLFRMFKQKREKRKMKKFAKSMGLNKNALKSASPDTMLILHALKNRTLTKKEIQEIQRKQAFKRWMLKTGFKAIIVGGVAYTLNEKKELIEKSIESLEEKFDDKYLSKIREAGDKASQAVADAADAATKKIIAAAEKMKNAIIEIINKITKLYRSITKRFKGVNSWDDVATDVKCSYDVDAGVLEVTFNFEAWIEWASFASKFIFNAEKFMTDRVNKTTESGFTGKNTQERVKLVSDFNQTFNDIKRKTDKIQKYTLNQVLNYITTLQSKFDDLEKHADDVQRIYDNIKQKVESTDGVDSKKLDFVYAVLNTVRGVMETIDDVDSTCDSITTYLEAFDEISSGDTESDTGEDGE